MEKMHSDKCEKDKSNTEQNNKRGKWKIPFWNFCLPLLFYDENALHPRSRTGEIQNLRISSERSQIKERTLKPCIVEGEKRIVNNEGRTVLGVV